VRRVEVSGSVMGRRIKGRGQHSTLNIQHSTLKKRWAVPTLVLHHG
jgi:hypothetical protein